MLIFQYALPCRRFILGALFFIISHFSYAQLEEGNCEKLKNFGKFYENPEGDILQSAKLFLSYQHQVGAIDGTDNSGKDFKDDFEEVRRFWMGLSGKFGTYWKFKVVSQLSMTDTTTRTAREDLTGNGDTKLSDLPISPLMQIVFGTLKAWTRWKLVMVEEVGEWLTNGSARQPQSTV